MSELEDRLQDLLAGRYAVEGEVGRGGMAIVYAARDLRHGRRVALKVLSPDLAQALGHERFLREIEIAARLIHPHILPLFDSGAADGLLFYAMPFVEGESLRQRMNRDKHLPVDHALEIAKQVAGALAFAHSQGIVHRDIKPENILLSGDAALVADFGIARAVTAAGGDRLTHSGIAIGTPTYMSPEQATGDQELDGRSDEYSLACVVYEMLAGEPPFSGPSIHAITARKIDHREAGVTLLRDSVPQSVGEAIHKALSPVPGDRFPTVAQFAEGLRERGTTYSATERLDAKPRSQRWERPLWIVAGAALALMAVFATRQLTARDASPRSSLVRMAVVLPADARITRGPGYNSSSVALSPDGRTLIIAGSSVNGQRLYKRPLDRLDATPIAGTEGGSSPFFSPDGAWIGFFAGGKIRRIPIEGGAAVDVAPVEGENFLSGASWGPDGRIIFAAGIGGPLYVTSVTGGNVTPLTTLAPGDGSHEHPEILPDGRTVLFQSGSRIHALDIASGRRSDLVTGQSPRYASGRVIFSRGIVILTAPFDRSRLEITGAAEPLIDGAAGDRGYVSHYAVSRGGTVAYLAGATTHDLVLVAEGGTERPVLTEPMAFQNPRFSPDGFRVAVATGSTNSDRMDIWIHDLRNNEASRLTFDGGRAPVWTPDGESITYSKLGDNQGIYTKRADGRGDAQLLRTVKAFHWLVGWTPDARTLVYGQIDGRKESSLLALTDGQTRVIVGPRSIWGGRLSPDGRWLAYYEREDGRFQVYVTSFPVARERWLISEDGGRDPSWGPKDNELYYSSGDRLMSARLDTSSGVRVIRRRQVLSSFAPPLYDDYHVHPDGRTVVHVRPHAESDPEVVLVLDALGQVDREARRD